MKLAIALLLATNSAVRLDIKEPSLVEQEDSSSISDLVSMSKKIADEDKQEEKKAEEPKKEEKVEVDADEFNIDPALKDVKVVDPKNNSNV